MTAVNSNSRQDIDHVAYLLHMATRRLRAEVEARVSGSVPPLRAAQARLLDLIPPDGGRATDMAVLARVSKQGLGQLVSQLAAHGYVETVPDPADRRAKLIRRTALGERAWQAIRSSLAAVEDQWRAQVGADRYATFHQVLREVVHATPPE
ncbi:MAG: MarR family winged helix-turn-helix transcriptional regulator [Pseudonocardiaceae bacterium]